MAVRPGAVFRKDGPWDWWRVVLTQFPSDRHYDGGLPGAVVEVSKPKRMRNDGTWAQSWKNTLFIPAKNRSAFVRWAKAEGRRFVPRSA
jgi:hypothetical protein